MTERLKPLVLVVIVIVIVIGMALCERVTNNSGFFFVCGDGVIV